MRVRICLLSLSFLVFAKFCSIACLLSLSCLLFLRRCVRLLGFLNSYINVQAWYSGNYFKRLHWHGRKEKVCNLEAYDNYVRKFKSDWEAAGLFINDKGILCKKEEVKKLRKHWANHMGLLRNKWSKLSQVKKLDNLFALQGDINQTCHSLADLQIYTICTSGSSSFCSTDS